MVGIADEAVVDRHQKSIDLRPHPLRNQRISLIGWPLSENRRKRGETGKFVDIAIAGTGTRAERLSGWIIPVAKRGGHHVLPRDGS